jgi:hypothetical protein
MIEHNLKKLSKKELLIKYMALKRGHGLTHNQLEGKNWIIRNIKRRLSKLQKEIEHIITYSYSSHSISEGRKR